MELDANVRSVNVTGSGIVKNGSGFCFGIIVNSHSSGTLKLWNNNSAALDGNINPQSEALVIDTFTFAAGSGIYMFSKPIPFRLLYATVGGTLNCQIIITRN